MKALRLSRGIALLFSRTFGTRMGLVVQSRAPAASTSGKTRCPLYRRLDGPQGRSGRVRKISSPTRIRSRTVQSIVVIPTELPGPPLYLLYIHIKICRSQWPRGLRRTAARLLKLWVRISPGAWMFVCCECCVLSGRSLCEELITRPEESYRL